MNLNSVSKNWTPEERLNVISVLASHINNEHPIRVLEIKRAILIVALETASFLEQNRVAILDTLKGVI